MSRYLQIIKYRPTLKPFLLFPTTLPQICQLFTTSNHHAPILKIKKILECARTFFCIVEKSPGSGNFFYPFVMEHHINLSPVLNPHFYSSICCQSLVISIRSQHNLYCRRRNIDSFITHFLSLIAIREKFWCNSFITHFFIFVAVGNIL